MSSRAVVRLPISAPALVGRELEYVMRCLETNWISSLGEFVTEFERGFAELCGVSFGVAVSSGTAALQLALLAVGLDPGDEVIIPTLSYIATAGAVTACGATPVFVDSDPLTWNMDPGLVREAITPRTRGIVAVHLYGAPADMDALRGIADEHGLFLVEDAAQAHGARYRGRAVGSLADAGTFSFYGNKLITTGEGGMVVTDDAERAEALVQLRNQGQDRRYHVTRHGFNYRMTNLAAAIGVAQLERIDWHLARRRENAAAYRSRLAEHPVFELQARDPADEGSDWLTSVVLADDVEITRDELCARLDADGIETRPIFPPIHTQPVYESGDGPELPVASRISARGLSLPSGAQLTEADIERVVGALVAAADA